MISSRMLMVNVRSGVPGQLRGLEYIYKTYGSKNVSWSDLFQPAIEVANVGWNVTNDILVMMDWALNGTMNSTDPKHNFFLQPAWKPDFAPNGTLVKEGDIIMRKRYAKTLQRMARPDGVNDFYNGSIADSIIRAINANQGIMTKDDLKNYTIAIRKTNQMKYRNYTLTSTTTPSCGSVVLNVLGVLNKYANYSIKPGQDNVNIHRMVESIKFAYGYVSLPFIPIDLLHSTDHLTSVCLSETLITREILRCWRKQCCPTHDLLVSSMVLMIPTFTLMLASMIRITNGQRHRESSYYFQLTIYLSTSVYLNHLALIIAPDMVLRTWLQPIIVDLPYPSPQRSTFHLAATL